ncbi:MAG: hypothetical protein U0L26_01515 [Cellulosilyticum sp.]|nr:hypothetical protein [Cellulosilyticum sp.]
MAHVADTFLILQMKALQILAGLFLMAPKTENELHKKSISFLLATTAPHSQQVERIPLDY